MGVRVVGLFASVSLLVGCGPDVYACTDHDQCRTGSAVGSCEASGFCSFPDAACASGRRYGGLAGDGLGGECVDEPSASTGAPPPNDSATGSGSTTTSTTTLSPGTSTDAASSSSSDAADASGSSETADPASCRDGVRNGDEVGVDCGGMCGGCDGSRCGTDADCADSPCVGGVCGGDDPTDDPACSDGMQNGAETGIDCGGTCVACGAPCEGTPAQWNPKDAQQNIDIVDEGFSVTVVNDSVNDTVRADTPFEEGSKVYWEIRIAAPPSGWVRLGAVEGSASLELAPNGNGFGLGRDGGMPPIATTGVAFGAGETVGIAFDVDTRRVWLHVDGVWGSGGNPTQGDGFEVDWDESELLFPSATLAEGDLLGANFGQDDFSYTIPPGFIGGVCH